MKANEFFVPPQHNLRVDFFLSWAVLGLTLIASALGIAFHARVYPTEDLAQAFLANDVTNLLVGIPVLLVPMWLAYRGQLAGVLFWLGAYFYLVYNYLVYVFAMPFNLFYFFFPAIVGLAIVGILRLLKKLDKELVREQLEGKVPTRFGGGVLVLLGIGFALRAIGIVVGSMGEGGLSQADLALNLADSILSIGWIAGGIAMWRRTSFGFAVGGGFLYQGSMLFLAVIVLAVIKPWMFGSPLVWIDVIVLAVMALVIVVPFGLFVRGMHRMD